MEGQMAARIRSETTSAGSGPGSTRSPGESHRVGLVVVHGIGEQAPGETLESVVDGLKHAYGDVFVRQPADSEPVECYSLVTGSTTETAEAAPEVRVYEAFWKPTLSGHHVKNSFSVGLAHHFIWFPWFNRRYIKGFSEDYPALVVVRWTAILVFAGALVTPLYWGASIFLDVLKWLLEKPREWDGLKKVDDTPSVPGWLQRLAHNLHKPAPESTRRNLVDRMLDNRVADVFNYVDSAGNCDGVVPEAEERIQKTFRATLQRAVEDGCNEIQVLAHSLGTVITYRALTCFRKEVEEVIAIGDDGSGRAALTRVHTIGSPLEKIRFFWPKLLAPADGKKLLPSSSLAWDNFRNPGDPVAGVIGRLDVVDEVANHTITGAWGLLTAHNSYRRSGLFLQKFGPAVTRRPYTRPVDRPRLKKSLSFVGQLASVVLGMVALAAFGLTLMFSLGLLLGILWVVVSSPNLGTGDLMAVLQDPRPWLCGALLPLLLGPGAVLSGYCRGQRIHQRWRKGFQYSRRRPMSETPKDLFAATKTATYLKPAPYGFLLAQVAILAAIGYIGFNAGHADGLDRPTAWMAIFALMAGFAMVAGRGITKSWRGILIDRRYKISLSRLQMLAWTLVVLTTVVTAMLTNVARDAPSPMSIVVPPELWVLLGIVTASAVGAPALLGNKHGQEYDPTELKEKARTLQAKGEVDVNLRRSDVIIINCGPEDARWADLLRGDEVGNADTVDLGKLQMFFFTFVLVLSYSAAILATLEGTDPFTALPNIDQSMNILLGISNTGYLANKTVNHSQPHKPVEPAADGGAPLAEVHCE